MRRCNPPTPSRPPRAAPTAGPQRLFGRWWRRQSPARQDRFATLGPLVSVLLFLAAIISAFWYLRNEEFEREQDSVKRDTEIAQQQIRLRLIENQEQLVRIAREIVTRTIDQDEFLGQAATFTRERPEITHLVWIGANRARRAQLLRHHLPGRDRAPWPSRPARCAAASEPEAAFDAARELRQPVYSRAFTDALRQRGLPGARAADRPQPPSPARWSPSTRSRAWCATSCRPRCRTATPSRCSTRSDRTLASTVTVDAGRRDAPRADRARRAARARPATAWCCAARATAPRSA